MPGGLKAQLKRWRFVLIALALIAVALSLVNASWLAPVPRGRLTVIAQGGTAQTFEDPGSDDCTARHIAPPGDNIYIEDTPNALYKAINLGADGVTLPVQATRDGRIVAFPDATLDCRTNGHGRIRDHDLTELKRLDLGYGYSPDGGHSFPLRGHAIGFLPTLDEALRELTTAKVLFAFPSGDPADADALIAALHRAQIPIGDRFGFLAAPAIAARLRQIAPSAWVIDPQHAAACRRDYARIGWTGIVPGSCRDATIVVPLDHRWTMWGWPYRFFDRMAKAKTKVLIVAEDDGGKLKGLTQPEQYGEVPNGFTGTLLVEDFYTMGPDLRR